MAAGGGLPAQSRHGPFRMVFMSVGEEMATSFGNVARSYDKVRPEPPAQALDWLVPPGCEVAVDLAAGTGLFTRALLGRAAQVVAVEPDERMRAVLAQRSPQVRVLQGWGEAMPLPGASADAVFVSTAWHWLDPARAVPEIGRVLRSGGRLGVIWTSRDRSQDWVAELDLLRLPGISEPDTDPDIPRTVDEVRDRLDREHSVHLPDGAEFRNEEAASFHFSRTVTVDATVEWLATNSRFITASAADRAAGLARCRSALLDQTGGAEVIQMPMRSWCWRADRMDRTLPKASGNNYTDSPRAPRSVQALPFSCGNGLRRPGGLWRSGMARRPAGVRSPVWAWRSAGVRQPAGTGTGT